MSAPSAVGAANTLWFDGGLLRSTNTDVEGFLEQSRCLRAGWDRDLTNAVVLGAGGAARAVVYALLTRGVERIIVVNRTPSAPKLCASASANVCRSPPGNS